MVKKIKVFLIIVLFCVILVGCSKADSYESDNNLNQNGESGVLVETTRKIYYTVNISIDCENINSSLNLCIDKAKQLNGYVSSSNITSDDDCTITLRIPTVSLDEFLEFVEGENDNKITNKNISSTDITTKYNQTQARLEVLIASRESYIKLLDQANSISEIIRIKTRIEEIDSEILQLENQISQYDNLVEYSTVIMIFNNTNTDSFIQTYLSYLSGLFVATGTIILYLLPFALIVLVILGIVYFSKLKLKQRKGKK